MDKFKSIFLWPYKAALYSFLGRVIYISILCVIYSVFYWSGVLIMEPTTSFVLAICIIAVIAFGYPYISNIMIKEKKDEEDS